LEPDCAETTDAFADGPARDDQEPPVLTWAVEVEALTVEGLEAEFTVEEADGVVVGVAVAGAADDAWEAVFAALITAACWAMTPTSPPSPTVAMRPTATVEVETRRLARSRTAAGSGTRGGGRYDMCCSLLVTNFIVTDPPKLAS